MLSRGGGTGGGAVRDAHASSSKGLHSDADLLIQGTGRETRAQGGNSEHTGSAANLPAYRSIQMTVGDGEGAKDPKGHQSGAARGGSRLGQAKGGDQSSNAKQHHSQRHPDFGVRGTGSGAGGAAASQHAANNTHQPRQKRQSMQRQVNSTTKSKAGATQSVGFGSATAAARGTPQTKTNNFMKKQDHSDMLTSGIAFNKIPRGGPGYSGKINNDISQQLDASLSYKFDANILDHENSPKKPSAEEDEIMREAAAALAETDAVLQTRKEALVQKHIEGRDSYHDLDYIFKDNSAADQRRTNAFEDMKNLVEKDDGVFGDLDRHRERRAGRSEADIGAGLGALDAYKQGKVSGRGGLEARPERDMKLFEWEPASLGTGKDYDRYDFHGHGSRAKEDAEYEKRHLDKEHADIGMSDADYVNLDLEAHQTRQKRQAATIDHEDQHFGGKDKNLDFDYRFEDKYRKAKDADAGLAPPDGARSLARQ